MKSRFSQYSVFCLVFALSFKIGNLSAQDFKNISLLDHWRVDTLASSQGIYFNEVWFFERNHREYAIIGSTEGTHFFEITDKDQLRFVGFVAGDFRSAQVHNRDFRDFGNYVYAVADQGSASALQIINISGLPDSVYLEKTDSTHWNRAHTICIDPNSALLYACSFRPPIGHPEWFYRPLKVFSLSDPLNPELVFSGFNNIDEVHYAHVRGDTAYLNCGFDGLRIYDFKIPSNPVLLGSLSVYNDQGYNHSGWLSEDGKTYFFTDESEGKRIKMVDVSDVSNPIILRNFGTSNFASSVAHHIIPVGDLLFVSYYNEGLRIFDTRVPVKEIAHYDTYPLNSLYKMNGAWGVYPFRNGKRILVSDRTFGLFLCGFEYELFSVAHSEENLLIFPNPVMRNESIYLQIPDLKDANFSVVIYDNHGREVFSNRYQNQTFAQIACDFAQGVYAVSVSYNNYLNEPERLFGRILVVE